MFDRRLTPILFMEVLKFSMQCLKKKILQGSNVITFLYKVREGVVKQVFVLNYFILGFLKSLIPLKIKIINTLARYF